MTGYSLHIGLNQVDPAAYNGWDGALTGCINDANSMQQLAADAGFQTTQLLDGDATSQAVIGEISLLAQQACDGDICLITYSGHGGQVDDNNGDEDDGQDETWVLYDRQVVDDELYQMWSQFAAGVRILVLSDSCHSGTIAKDMMCVDTRKSLVKASASRSVTNDVPAVTAQTPRAMPHATEVDDNNRRRGTYQFVQALSGSKSDASIDASLILISGCQDNQLSYDGAVNGQFTGTLLSVWASGTFAGDHDAFHRGILAQMPPDQSPNLTTVGTDDPAFLSQRPFTIDVPRPAPAPGSSDTPTTGPSTGPSTGLSTGPATGPGTSGQTSGNPGTTNGGTVAVATRPTVRRGANGAHVTYLQTRLKALGYTIAVDGVFGPGTESTVRSFQRSNSLTADGIVGPQTWALLG